MKAFLKYAGIPFRLIYKLYFLLLFSMSMLLSYPLYFILLKNPSRYKIAFKIMKFHSKSLNLLSFTFNNVIGFHNVPDKGAYIICPNHSSFLDILSIYSTFKNYFVFTGKKQILKWPLFSIFYSSGMNIIVDRESRADSFKAFKRIVREIDADLPIVIFPEGTISKSAPKLTDFKGGAFTIAIQKQIPILPVTFVNNWLLLQRGSLLFGRARPGRNEMIIHAPIETKGLKKEDAKALEERVKNIINAPLILKWACV